MQLTLAHHPITDLRFDAPARLEGTVLFVDVAQLRGLVLKDDSIVSVDFDIVRPGEACRAGPIFDVIEPRAKAPGCGADFPRGCRRTDYRWHGHDARSRGRRGISPCGNFARPHAQRYRPGVGDEWRSGRSERLRGACTLTRNPAHETGHAAPSD